MAQLAEQPRIFDGDDGLRGEVLHEGYLFVGKWFHHLAIKGDESPHRLILQQRHHKHGTGTTKVDYRPLVRITTAVNVRIWQHQ